MKEVLEQNGYVLEDYSFDWIKGSWTIRLDEDYIEAFQDLTDPSNNKYLIWPKDIESLLFIIKEIDKL
jgi:hypothetical protein